MRYGRRCSIIAFNFVGIIGSILSVFPHLKVLCFGRFLYGFSAGVMIVLAPKSLIETIPARIYDNGFGASTNSAIQILIVISTFLISWMPDQNSSKSTLKSAIIWKILYIIPIPLMLLALLLSIYAFKHDSVGFLI